MGEAGGTAAPGNSAASGAAARAQIAGPVFFRRWPGKYLGRKVDLEVWEIRDRGSGPLRHVAELSFKAKSHAEAADGRERMIAGLKDLGLLLEKDSLKTGLILDACLPTPAGESL
ncbi:MAG: hypothetical protein J5855_01255 [Mailhella sp.]|nr:hypothetical protein [Mailhella sp.]